MTDTSDRPDILSQRWAVRVLIRSSLEYHDGTGPKTDKAVRGRGEEYSRQVYAVLAEAFPKAERVQVDVLRARHGSAELAHAATLLFNNPVARLDCAETLTKFIDEWVEIFETGWELQEGRNLQSVSLRVSVSGGKMAATSSSARSTVSNRLDHDLVMRAVKVRERMIWIFLDLGIFIGIVAAFVAFTAVFILRDVDKLRNDVDELRTTGRSEQTTSDAGTVVVYPPPTPPVIVRPQEREPPCPTCSVIRPVP